MAIKRELRTIHITITNDPLLDQVQAVFTTTDDVEISVDTKEKTLNVGQQLRDALAPVVAIVLDKLTNNTRVVTRPV